jgi:hypothetical protein
MAKDPFPCYSRLCGRIRPSRSLYRVEATALFPPDKPDRLRHPHEDFDEADCFEPLDPLAHLGRDGIMALPGMHRLMIPHFSKTGLDLLRALP